MLSQKILKIQWLRTSKNVFEPAKSVQNGRKTSSHYKSNSNFLCMESSFEICWHLKSQTHIETDFIYIYIIKIFLPLLD